MSERKTVQLSEVLLDAKPGFACGEDPAEGVFQFRMNNLTTDGHLDFTGNAEFPVIRGISTAIC
jgi:hypothetical protein